MKLLVLMLFLCWITGITQAQRNLGAQHKSREILDKSLVFHSSKEFNQYRFAKNNLQSLTHGYLLDMEEEWTGNQIDSFLNETKKSVTNVDKLLSIFNCLERTDVNYIFEKDSLLFPIMDSYLSAQTGEDLDVPLFILDYKVSRFTPQKRKEIENWSSNDSYNQFSRNDFLTEYIFSTSFFGDTIRNEHINLYWDNTTLLSNRERKINSLQLKIGEETITLSMGERLSLASFLRNGAINKVEIIIEFDDETIFKKTNVIFFTKNPPYKLTGDGEKAYGVYQGQIGNHGIGTHSLNFTVYYGCGKEGLKKPIILVAGWGPYVDQPVLGPLINSVQGWPSTESELYVQWNQANIFDELREAGFDIVLARFTPPNASIRANTDKLKILINWVNEQKSLVGSNEENIIIGYSAGAMCARLALQEMEKEHLEQNKPHPHTKLYISYDGEHGGAHIPLSVQHAVRYLDEYQGGLTVFTLNYILNAPLSKQLLHYFHSKTGNASTPGQGRDDARSHLMWWHEHANHAKSVENPNDPYSRHNPNYPAFSRNISISNGMNESNYSGNSANHFPYPTNFGHILFEQNNSNRKWKAEFNIPGGNRVFYYQTKPLIGNNWSIVIDAMTSSNCMMLDNAPGGTVFVEDNPLTHVMQQMKSKITIGDPTVYNPHTQFCFTPTVFTHDIRNFSPTNGKIAYSMKNNGLMFQNLYDFNNEIFSNYYGYPHIAHPYSHYWEVTPFDAVFSTSVNTEHLRFNSCIRSDLYNNNEEWSVDNSSIAVQQLKTVIKKFIKEEADCINAYIQNKRYGWNAREDGIYRYKADIITLENIYVGKEVTQRTDFKDVDFLSNSDTKMRAEESIVFKPGTHIHAGATLHAKIEPYYCASYQGLMAGGVVNSKVFSKVESEEELKIEALQNGKSFIAFPNPTESKITIRSLEGKPYHYTVYDFSGQLLYIGESSNDIDFELKEGIYIIKTQNHETTETHKVIVR